METQKEDENARREKQEKLLHNARTCLAVIKTQSEVALINPSITADLKEIMENNIKEVDRVAKILNEFLD